MRGEEGDVQVVDFARLCASWGRARMRMEEYVTPPGLLGMADDWSLDTRVVANATCVRASREHLPAVRSEVEGGEAFRSPHLVERVQVSVDVVGVVRIVRVSGGPLLRGRDVRVGRRQGHLARDRNQE
eukprot:scaffold153348_cov28-Tisochrysis_lutea.AAC.3